MRTLIILILTLVSGYVYAQDGYSSASVSMNRANGVLSPDEIVVEEYINYHRHAIRIPKDNAEEIALSLDFHPRSEEAIIFQVGIATKKLLDYSDMPPVNVSLVIDRSGSMGYDNKLNKVKKALLRFIKGLRPTDYVSIITYENEAKVLLESQQVGRLHNLENVIQSIAEGGSTNLHGGLILGYEQVEKHFNPNHSNKVILLTDGIANTGITNAEKIVADSYAYNQKGIDISTIGVGRDLNHVLLQQIARRGRGSNHFVGNEEEDIIKVFDNELQSLLSPVAKEAYVELEFPDPIKVKHLFGYAPEFNQNHIKIPLNNMNHGLTQVILAELQLPQKKSLRTKATLHYFSYSKGKHQKITQSINLKSHHKQVVKRNEIVKNFHIGQMAQALKKIADEIKNKRYQSAKQILEVSLHDVNQNFPFLRDKDILRVKNILLQQKGILDKYFLTQNTK